MYKISSSKKLQLHKTVSLASLETIQKEHVANPHDLFWAYHALIFQDIPLPKNATDEIFWKKLTKSQQIVFVLGIFIEHTNNGGIWQFFFNKTEYIIAVGQAFETFSNMNVFNTYYSRCFNELAKILDSGEFFTICDIWNDTNRPFEERWTAFKSGEAYIENHTLFEEYFYSEKGKDRLYNDLINKYIAQNLGALVLVEGATVRKEIDKKAAIPHFTAYLTEFYGVEPTEVSVYYTASVTIKNAGRKLFLMRFTMPDGYESLGITGYFTLHFADVDWSDIRGMYQRNHKQELINIFHGAYLLAEYKAKEGTPQLYDEADWLVFLAKLQDPTRTQIPVNVVFKDCLWYNDLWHYTYLGDLLYNEKSTVFPADLSNVPVLSVRDKNNTGYHGELNCLFSSVHTATPNFGRQSPAPSLSTKHLWEEFIGKQNKLVKDNPWGF